MDGPPLHAHQYGLCLIGLFSCTLRYSRKDLRRHIKNEILEKFPQAKIHSHWVRLSWVPRCASSLPMTPEPQQHLPPRLSPRVPNHSQFSFHFLAGVSAGTSLRSSIPWRQEAFRGLINSPEVVSEALWPSVSSLSFSLLPSNMKVMSSAWCCRRKEQKGRMPSPWNTVGPE